MATETTPELPRNFASFKQGRKPPEKEEKAAASEPKGEKAEKPLASETSKTSETAGDSETPKPQEQPKRHDADDRVRILTKRQKEMEEKHDRELRERDEKHATELAEIRKLLVTKVAAPSEPQPKAEPTTTAPAAAAGEPDWDAFLANAPKDEALGKTITRFNREHLAWLNAQEHQKTQRTAAEQKREEQFAKAREKHGAQKVDAALGTKEDPMSGIALAQGVIPFLAQYDNWVDVLVHLQENPAEYRKIFAMPPQQQLGELVFLARTLNAAPSSEETPALEKPKPSAPPTSRIPAPMRVVGGTEASTPKTTAEAGSFSGFKKVSRYGNRRGA